MYWTQNDIINLQLRMTGTASESDIFKELIKEHRESEHVKEAIEGDTYFTVDNAEILSRDFTEYIDSEGVIHNSEKDPRLKDKPNNRIPTGQPRKQVLEKAAYLAKNPIIITHPDESVVEKYMEIVGRKFHSFINQVIEDASNRGRAWIHFFIDGKEFGYQAMSTVWIIPIYETSRQERLVRLIRYYPVELNIAGETKEVYRLEDWTAKTVSFWQQDQSGEFQHDETTGHFTFEDEATGERTTVDAQGNPLTESWGRVPWLEVRNNPQAKSDLHFIKNAIDAYDAQISTFANDLEIRQALIKAMGTSQNPADLYDLLMKYGVITLEATVGEAKQDVDYLRIDIPYLAKRECLQKLEQIIARTGMALEFDQEKFGDPSGVALRFLYAPLDLKAGLLESRLKLDLYDFFWFVDRFESMPGGPSDDDAVDLLQFVFDKHLIINEIEGARLANESQGSVSEETRLSYDPRVDDATAEMERMDAERKQRMKEFQDNMPDDDSDDDEE